jgi:hypothetical protein
MTTKTHPPRPGTVRERVSYIKGLMAALEFEKGETIYELSEQWDLAVSTIGGYSAEASRQVTGDEHEARRDISAGCRKLFVAAVNDGDRKGAKAIGELWAKVSGAMAPERIEQKITGVSLDDIAELKKTTGFAGSGEASAAEQEPCPPTENESASEPES